MFIVFLVVFIDLLGFGIVLPLLPIYGDNYVTKIFEGGKQSFLGGLTDGLLMASFSAMQFLFAPIWGRVSDQVGRRPILLIGLGGSVVFYILFGYASSLPADSGTAAFALILLFAARIGAGVAGATIATAQAVIADSTPPERRKQGMALIGAAFGIGFTFGPLIGAGALQLKSTFPTIVGDGATGYVAAALSFVALMLGVLLLPETRRFDDLGTHRSWINFSALSAALGDPKLAPVVWTFFLGTLGFAGFEVTLSFLNRDALKLDPQDNFFIFAYVGFVLVLAQGVLYRRLAKRVSEPTFIAFGLALMGLGVVTLGGVNWAAAADWLPNASSPDEASRSLFVWTFVGLTVAVTGFALLTPSAQALVSRRSDPARQGEFLGVNQSAAAMARILGPVFGLSLYKATSNHLLPYIFGAGLLFLMLPFVPMIRRGGRESAEGA
jgi:MFS family permease